jgi:hypothetical protein
MKPLRILLVSAGMIIAVILAFFMQDVIRRLVVTPLAYLWWLLKLGWASLPQLVLWILLLTILVLIVFANLLKWISIKKKSDKPARPAQGPVETLAVWISKSGQGNYYKWMIANRLGKLWGEMSGRSDNRNQSGLPVESEVQARHSPEELQKYLKAGMEESFVDYPLPALPFMRRRATPFDLDVAEAIEFLESQLEANGGKKHP